MGIYSEIAPLKRVILHRPLHSLLRLTPSNCKKFLFDDVLWPEKAAEKHDVFSQLLKDLGVEVYFLENLLTETVANPEAKSYLISHILGLQSFKREAKNFLSNYLFHLGEASLVKVIIGGLIYADLDEPSELLCHKKVNPYDFILPPLPNHLFMRDSSSWVGDNVLINDMAFPVRRPEAANMATIYKYHPAFIKKGSLFGSEKSRTDQPKSSLEGGDVLVISQSCILIGVGERTKYFAVKRLAKNILQTNPLIKILVIEIPKKRAYMHLDIIMTMVDYETFCVAFPDEWPRRAWEIKIGKSNSQLVINQVADIFSAIARGLCIKKLKIIDLGGDFFSCEREQWTDACNLLTIKPGTVVSYECNVNAVAKLKKEHIDVITIPGAELIRGRGGPRCMSCPVDRE